jgi:hypothetical protein
MMHFAERASMALAVLSIAIGAVLGAPDHGAYFVALAIYLRLLRKGGGR